MHGWVMIQKLMNKKLADLIKLANEGYVDIAAVGNEVMYRGDLTEDELLEFIYQVKEAFLIFRLVMLMPIMSLLIAPG